MEENPAPYAQDVKNPRPDAKKESVSTEIHQVNEVRGEDRTVTLPQIAGRYRIIRPLGRGAFGEVLSAWDRQLERAVAVKLIRNAGSAPENARARFLREMRILAKLDHPNIVTLFDAGAENCGEHGPYLVMKLVEGCSLNDYIRKGRIEERDTLPIIQQSASALSYAHSHEILHRDLKPSNVLLDKEKRAYLVDFGLATLTTSTSTKLTSAGTIVGTPRYLAPEMLDGIYTEKGDLYALGAILYEMLFGEPCFASRDQRTLFIKISKEDPPLLASPPVAISPESHDLLRSLLHKEPARRPDSAEAVVNYIAAALSDAKGPRTARPTLVTEPSSLARVDAVIEAMASHHDSIMRLTASPSANLDEILSHLSDAIGLGNASLLGIQKKGTDEEAGHLYPRALTLLQIAESIEAAMSSMSEDCTRASSIDTLLLQFHFNVLSPLAGFLKRLEKTREEEVNPPDSEFFSFDEERGEEPQPQEGWLDDLVAGSELRRHEAILVAVGAGRDVFLSELRSCAVDRRQTLLESAWQCSDVILSRGRSRSKAIFDTVLSLDSDPDVLGKWRVLFSLFRKPSDSGYWDAEMVDGMVEDYPESDRRAIARALLFHPSLDYRRLALHHLKPHDFWWLIVDENVPFHWILEVWRHLRTRVDSNFLKIAFVSLRGRLLSAHDGQDADVGSILSLLKEFYQVGSFHETTFFNMLTQLHETLRSAFQRHQSLFDFDQEYVEKFSQFLQGQPTQDQPVQGWGRVPLPVQRLLARRGHFQRHFACHPIDPIALECLRHILIRENISDFLELYGINGKLLHEITKESRFFRDEQFKYLLVSNPKASAVTVARYLSFLRNDFLTKVANSRDCNQVARALAEKILKRRGK